METTFYDTPVPNEKVQSLKNQMTLDFSGSKTRQGKGMNGILSSPDLNMLKLASPELERLIIQQNGMVTTTPTQILFPRSVTEEQEAYARGFVDALAELHSTTGGDSQVTSTNATVSNSAANFVTLTSSLNNMPLSSTGQLTTTTALPGSILIQPQTVTVVPMTTDAQDIVVHSDSSMSSVMSRFTDSPMLQTFGNIPHPSVIQAKEEPQTVPCLGYTPPMSPINMDNQEVIKVDRKRARNRVAARKCRERKLERISRLEERVTELKGQNTELSTTATDLREQVYKLKQQIMEHVSSGCQVMLSPNLL